ncbi:MAG TPA: rhodanese-like domain-containing protein [Polyangiales bacterium]|jgi:rhodanese-related sulfurtransferase|nr:rhodanese-like domain-containing protein [Polyangiales bacterium]
MRIIHMLALAAFALPTLVACNEAAEKPQLEAPKTPIKTVTIPEVAQMIEKHEAVIIDANGDKTRKEMGVIPTAVMLSDHEKYSMIELPPNKTQKLVFYCGSLQCGASHVAAERAIEAGYSDVAVLPDGIKGWKQAGQATTPAPQS